MAVGGSEIPTKLSSDASMILDGSLPLGSLSEVLNRIQQEGNILLQTQAGIVNQARSGTLAGTQTSQSNTVNTVGGSTSGSIYSW